MRHVFIDSSVWIDHLRGATTRETVALRNLVAANGDDAIDIVVGDLVLLEVLRGVDDRRQAERVRQALLAFTQVQLGGTSLAISAADHFRRLRQRGSTIRNGIDCMIAAWCIRHGVPLLHRDRDFQPFATHCGLTVFGG